MARRLEGGAGRQIDLTFRIRIEKGALVAHEGPPSFQEVLDQIGGEERILVREFGLGLNPAMGKSAVLSDITAFVGDGTGGWTVPAWHTQTADAKCVKFDVDLRHRKRYLKLTITPVTTQDFIAIANLGRNEATPVSGDQRELIRG